MTRYEQDDLRADLSQPLLRPVSLGDLRLANRVVIAPLTRARADNAERVPTDLHTTHYGQRAGAGLIIAEGTWVSEEAIGFPHVPGIYTERQVAAWRHVTAAVHELGGRMVLQLWHTGANSHPDHHGGALPAGPSAINPNEYSPTPAGRRTTVTPREMTPADIERTIADYATASANARHAGFDGVEIASNGTYLLAQFLNPRMNRRTDAYGTDRHRLLREIVDAAAAEWDGRRVGVRLSPYWTALDRSRTGPAPDGYPYTADEQTLADHDRLAAELSDHPLAYLHLRGPAPTAASPDFDAIARYRKHFTGPLIANHGYDRDTGNAIIEAGIADAVSYGTHYIANPDLTTRFALGHALARSDRATHYSGGVNGYNTYPALQP